MRKTIKTDRPITFLIPVWHSQTDKQFNRLSYMREMVKLELKPGTYSCEMLDKLVVKGADTDLETQDYLESLGYIPNMDPEMGFSGVTTGLDPEEELN